MRVSRRAVLLSLLALSLLLLVGAQPSDAPGDEPSGDAASSGAPSAPEAKLQVPIPPVTPEVAKPVQETVIPKVSPEVAAAAAGAGAAAAAREARYARETVQAKEALAAAEGRISELETRLRGEEARGEAAASKAKSESEAAASKRVGALEKKLAAIEKRAAKGEGAAEECAAAKEVLRSKLEASEAKAKGGFGETLEGFRDVITDTISQGTAAVESSKLWKDGSMALKNAQKGARKNFKPRLDRAYQFIAAASKEHSPKIRHRFPALEEMVRSLTSQMGKLATFQDAAADATAHWPSILFVTICCQLIGHAWLSVGLRWFSLRVQQTLLLTSLLLAAVAGIYDQDPLAMLATTASPATLAFLHVLVCLQLGICSMFYLLVVLWGPRRLLAVVQLSASLLVAARFYTHALVPVLSEEASPAPPFFATHLALSVFSVMLGFMGTREEVAPPPRRKTKLAGR